ncbi:MAG TPA: tyrosine--tRNA ligase [Polyangiaceae bacterium]|nr:tyrosine--tRNA ligase [Polyangiaceae bacterium]
MTPDEQFRELTRGTVDLHQPDELRKALASGRPLRVKAGFDPTRPDLHLGHTVLMQKMRQFQELGHQVVFLIGDFTAMVGDPTGQNEMRPRLTREQVLDAARTYQDQAFKILDRSRTEVRYNSEWLSTLRADEMIELLAKRTVARTLERRDFKDRYEHQKDIYLHELLYPMLQGYDSVALDADVELGGTDQLFNLMVGRDLMQRYGKRPQVVMTTPILEGIDARIEDGKIVGKKMSKSAENYIGLTEPPLEIFRKCMQIDDSVIWRFFELLSSRTRSDIEALRRAGDPLAAKKSFAAEIVDRFHGAEAAARAAEGFDAAYFSDRPPDDTPELRLTTEGESLWLPKALSMAKLVASTSEGRRMIEQGGVEVDGKRVSDVQLKLALEQRYLVRVGSKKRRYCYINVSRQ